MKYLLKIGFTMTVASLICCNTAKETKQVSIINKLDIARKAETVSIPFDNIKKFTKEYNFENILVKDIEAKTYLLTQLVDNNSDGIFDELLFQVDIGANSEKKYQLEVTEDTLSTKADMGLTTFGRFVPERIDDFAWENDRVAFRIYGPKAQQITESGQEGGTLSSGVDCWLKKVNYSVINKWYKNNTENPGYYHIDHGEGYDPYHVGSSLGCGGIGIWEEDTLYTSKNYSMYKVIANGPIRTIFEVDYAPWTVKENIIEKKKRISIDLGSNLSRYEVEMTAGKKIENSAIGITLHEKQGVVATDSVNGWFSYWESIDKSELGTAIVIDPKFINSYRNYRVDEADKSHLFVFAKPIAHKLIYYTGFTWVKSHQFQNFNEWNKYLKDFSKRIASPLVVKY